jgi:hypothetical protein
MSRREEFESGLLHQAASSSNEMWCNTQDADAATVEARRGSQGPEIPGVSIHGRQSNDEPTERGSSASYRALTLTFD